MKTNLKIKPVGDQIFLKVEEAKLGGLDTGSMKTGMEWGVIEAIGPEVKDPQLKVGTKVFCKAWAQDVILYEGKNYIFTSEARRGICAAIT